MRLLLYISILTILLPDNIQGQKLINNDFSFPLDITPSVSGSFAELRTNHFHSGIDLSTNGKTGLPVKCMMDGIVSRIKVSPVGYGNAVYVKHPNGYTTVYGHLKKYAPKIDSVITKEQYKAESFSIDYFPQEEISFKKGETIGFSGNSGSSGGPHLHYEIRDTKTEEPVNPSFFQSKIKDNVRPKLMNIRIYPMDTNSLVNGENKARNYPVVFYDGKYHLKGNPKIYTLGKIGIGIEMLDYLSDSWKKCGVYSLDMTVNNKKTFGWDLDRFSFYESRYINSHIDYSYKSKNGKRFQRCFRQPNNKLSIYNQIIDDGIISMDTVKNITLVAKDAANNISELSFKLLKSNSSSLNQAPEDHEIKNSLFNADNFLESENIQCFIPKGALYENDNIVIKETSSSNKQSIYIIGDKSIPLHKHITLKIAIPDTLRPTHKGLCLASTNGSGKNHYAGGSIENDKMVLKTRSFGNYKFAIDTIAPKIGPVNFRNKMVYKRTSTLIFKISDSFSGIQSYNGYLNGKWTLFEYDAKSNTLICQLSKAPKFNSEKIELKLVIDDNCGNSSIFEGDFILSQNN
ncbi:M23 family metallopeptidase [Plebeiibacterium marinum]|uniref:M23 family metallopeptidase n=1 Tax=Plebeiibacterium marinum TaxID=2992111 RepID=A0AAE3MBN0_9BACT|nr:M23 family metallopeptidase [Plebeiobacterium marinum]MCW3804634.1 M23 family metallopeptidase [Plebeiobacterium marinum]